MPLRQQRARRPTSQFEPKLSSSFKYWRFYNLGGDQVGSSPEKGSTATSSCIARPAPTWTTISATSYWLITITTTTNASPNAISAAKYVLIVIAISLIELDASGLLQPIAAVGVPAKLLVSAIADDAVIVLWTAPVAITKHDLSVTCRNAKRPPIPTACHLSSRWPCILHSIKHVYHSYAIYHDHFSGARATINYGTRNVHVAIGADDEYAGNGDESAVANGAIPKSKPNAARTIL